MGRATGVHYPRDNNPEQNAEGKVYTASAGALALGLVPAFAGEGAAAGGGAALGGAALGSNPVGWGILIVGGIIVGGTIVYMAVQNSRSRSRSDTNVAVRGRDEVRMCPVCGLGPDINAPPPDYLNPPRVPQASETIPPLTGFRRTGVIEHGAMVYERPDGSYAHLDTLHRGRGAEIETYDRQGRHLGAICPRCGRMRPGSQVPGRRINI